MAIMSFVKNNFELSEGEFIVDAVFGQNRPMYLTDNRQRIFGIDNPKTEVIGVVLTQKHIILYYNRKENEFCHN